mmetsp:Transcript_81328/g.235827  ORF Transcript_81328/g.235827 Transcript_81328/m.235827 type:complete len:372 (-) Transcript_81328:164-1279(-)
MPGGMFSPPHISWLCIWFRSASKPSIPSVSGIPGMPSAKSRCMSASDMSPAASNACCILASVLEDAALCPLISHSFSNSRWSCVDAVAALVSYKASQSTSLPSRSMTVLSLNCRSPLLTLSMKLTNWELANFGLPLLRNISTICAACSRSALSWASWFNCCPSAAVGSAASATVTGIAAACAGACGAAMGIAMPPMPIGDAPMAMPPIMWPMPIIGIGAIIGPMGPMGRAAVSAALKAASMSAPCRIWACMPAGSAEDADADLIANSPAQSCGPMGRCIIIPPGPPIAGPADRAANSAAHCAPGPVMAPIGPSVKKPASRMSAPMGRCMCCRSCSGIEAPMPMCIGGLIGPTSPQAASIALPPGLPIGSSM